MDDAVWLEVDSAEAWIRSEIAALATREAPLVALNAAVTACRERLDELDELLRRAAVAAAGAGASDERTLQARLRQRGEDAAALRSGLRGLKERVRRNSERHAERERAALLSGSDGGDDGAATAERSAVRRAAAGTSALREAAALMRREVDRMHEARAETEAVSGLMGEAADRHRELSGGLAVGHALVGRMARRDLTDRLLIAFAVAVFACIVAYVFKQRTVG